MAAGGKPRDAGMDIHPVDSRAGTSATASADIEMVSGVHAQLLEACDRLESICDSLPHKVSRVDCLEMALWLDQAFPELIEREERSLLRIAPPAGSGSNHATGDVWRRYHRTDVTYAGELAEALEGFARRDQAGAVDTLAYMMRGFFEALRRHVAYEDLLVASTGAGNRDN